MHASVAGPGRPAILHTKPGNRRTDSHKIPALSSASRPDETGPGAHRTLTPPPSSWKSTTIVTPTLSRHAPGDGVAAGDRAGGNAIASAETARPALESRC